MTLYGESGSLISPPVIFQNAYVAQLPSGRFIQTVRNLDTGLGTSPATLRWTASCGMVVRTSYLYSQTRSLYVVTPLMSGPGRASLLGLSSTGGSDYHELEATLHYQPGERTELNVSYTHSRVRGDLNTLAEVFVQDAQREGGHAEQSELATFGGASENKADSNRHRPEDVQRVQDGHLGKANAFDEGQL